MATPFEGLIKRKHSGEVLVKASIFPWLYSLFAASGLFLCLSFALYLHYAIVTKNHCRVWEFWPSVSSTLGNRAPENIIWRCAIGLASGPRIASCFLKYAWIKQDIHPSYLRQAKIALGLDLFRVLLAGFWTFVSSSEHWLFHAWSFIFYASISGIHMKVFNDVMHKAKIANKPHPSPEVVKSHRLKTYLLKIQFYLSMLNIFIYVVPHYSYCAPGAYSFYALNEWVFSALNVMYDASAVGDLNFYVLVS